MNSVLYQSALAFAERAHANQTRKSDNSPYINHPIHVAQILSDMKCDDEIIASAILHDVVEDSDFCIQDIQTQFGSRVAQIVNDVTNPDTADKIAKKQAQIDKTCGMCLEAMLVKVADKIDNLTDHIRCPIWNVTRTQGYFFHAQQVVLAMIKYCFSAPTVCNAERDKMLFVFGRLVETFDRLLGSFILFRMDDGRVEKHPVLPQDPVYTLDDYYSRDLSAV